MSLTAKQELFVQHFTGDHLGNAAASARAAGYADGSAKVEGYRLRRDPEIRARIDEYMRQNAMTQGEVMAGLSEMARDPSVMPLARVKAYETLARVHGMIIERSKAEQTGGLTVRVVRESKSPDAAGKATAKAPPEAEIR